MAAALEPDWAAALEPGLAAALEPDLAAALLGLLLMVVPLMPKRWHCLQEVLEPALRWMLGSAVQGRLAHIWAGRTRGSQMP